MIAYSKASRLYTSPNAYIKFYEVVRLIYPHLGINILMPDFYLILIARLGWKCKARKIKM